uniref:Beta-lactamase domain-containing protein n=1 Tax=Parastrongyloides trichosuri TaxID=131310 RepID=A0A0N5A014_PARTI
MIKDFVINIFLLITISILITPSSYVQVIHPPKPNEQDWVLVAGNETSVDKVLAISLAYGGRLVSMNYYIQYKIVYYYAIMHKYNGPVFLKPNPVNLTQLGRLSKENIQLDLVPTQLCGQDSLTNDVMFSTYWERIPNAKFEIWFPGSSASDYQKHKLEKDGYYLFNICGYSMMNRAQYVGVWLKLNNTESRPYQAYYGLTLREALNKDKILSTKGFIPTRFQCFNNRNSVLCSGIWEYYPKNSHSIEIGDNLKTMYNKVKTLEFIPRQISHFFNEKNVPIFIVVWSNLDTYRFPEPADIWKQDSVIPFTLYKGSLELLKEKQLDFLNDRVSRFMKELDIPGLSIAISKHEKLKFAAGYGYADLRNKKQVTPDNQFRVGSISKPITAAAIMLLVDRKILCLEGKIFGRQGYLGTDFVRIPMYGKYIEEIKLKHLLEHTSGGWDNLTNDPAWIEPNLDLKDVIETVLENFHLQYKPGTQWLYSNFGYLLLGYIIEKYSNMSYEAFVKENIWKMGNVTDIEVAKPTVSEKAKREVLYYMSGNKVGFNPYDLLPPSRTGPWGGWIASPIELLHFMRIVDGFPFKKDILSVASIKSWQQPSEASNGTYSLGWSINVMGFNGWQHDGRMPGSAAMLVRLDNGVEMAITCNKEYSEREFFHEIGFILHHVGNNCDWWNNDIDLF